MRIHITKKCTLKKCYNFLDKQQIEPEEPSTTHDEVKIEQPPVSQSKTETEQAPKKSDVSFYKYSRLWNRRSPWKKHSPWNM